ncbi:hypothetical protein ABEB36_011946 [Hypothenemus hampei]|uniref:RRM domain-containing protein n=1 Tax=Hypothenemus hampei TaxID=57062 RepID=A0ABD1E9K3_HYPHA
MASCSNNIDFSRPPPGFNAQRSFNEESNFNRAPISSSGMERPGSANSSSNMSFSSSHSTPSPNSRYGAGHNRPPMNYPPPPPPPVPQEPLVYPPPPPAPNYPAQSPQPGPYPTFNPPVRTQFIGIPMYVDHNYGTPMTFVPNQGGYNNVLNRKRHMSQDKDESPMSKKGNNKKKKKSISQNAPARKSWTKEEAERAFQIEKEYNKGGNNQSLVITFPDKELNKEIVTGFHPKIQNVHFHKNFGPRFCFVTLSDPECMNKVIQELNETKFGEGYLIAEPKFQKEENPIKGPEDIDPLILFVGNLSQDVAVDDVYKRFPKYKRVDIGYGKKMKNTRYAFVSFYNVNDAIEAFKANHGSLMHNKSLIVRFRRLTGTVGLPGDPKPPRKRDGEIEKRDNEAEDIQFSQNLDNETHKRDTSGDDCYNVEDYSYDDDDKSHVPKILIKEEEVDVKIKKEPIDGYDYCY